MDQLRDRGLVLLGCGKMGSAMLQGWLNGGLPASSVWVREPHPSDWLITLGVHLQGDLPQDPAVVVVAVKPQMMEQALQSVAGLGGGKTLFLSIAAGTTIATYERILGAGTPVIRAMPNTPAAIGRGITAIIGNDHATGAHMELAETLLSAVGPVVRLHAESQMDAVTAVSGSGPAYVFHLVEALAEAGRAKGLPADLAMQLARATVSGAGALLDASSESAEQLRRNVTSPGGTTEAALKVLMDPDTGLTQLMKRAVHAAAERGRELGK
ncbi:pyrroline-5-carboxylate reductase [Albidovulum inexpectatum]|uniref:Pyrroline-5-carboxylate reductase n=1 Tax=Albidovulum inexpectatum TaxID=196587 RepID=A0A2S5JEG4_9RHOB|nr:pyrroline-5-carboxylate reductase [Albidovulum inexpectatum]PPB79877.1 pyrroline-5-carboxylate reductase [Albidovulum inexpectatum]